MEKNSRLATEIRLAGGKIGLNIMILALWYADMNILVAVPQLIRFLISSCVLEHICCCCLVVKSDYS